MKSTDISMRFYSARCFSSFGIEEQIRSIFRHWFRQRLDIYVFFLLEYTLF